METVADALATCLMEAGVEVVFGLPGGENVEVLDALRRRGIRFVLVHHESSAAFMAAASARLRGRPGVCLTTLGPGATNAVAGVAHAHLDRAPVLVITAQASASLRARHTHQVVDLHALFAPITKASLALEPQGAYETIRGALALTLSGRPGPVHLQVSNDDAGKAVVPVGDATIPRPSDAPVEAQVGSLERARGLLSRFTRPVILAGLGLEPEGPYRVLRQLAEAARAPVIVTPKAKGALPDDHPLAAGTIGLTHTDPVYEILGEADGVFAVGFDVVELVRPWEHPAPIIWLAPWANHDPTLPAAVELCAPMGDVLAGLTEGPFATASDWGEVRLEAHRRAQKAVRLPEPSPGRVTPQAVLHALRRSLPRQALVATDVGSHKIFFCLEWPAYVPNRFLVSNGLSSMGYGLPAAIAAGLVLGDEPVVCLIGDAGLAMSMGELGTLARLGAPVTVVVFSDGALDLIRSHQLRAGKPAFGTELVAPDFVGVARAFGIEARRVENEAACAEVVAQAVVSGRPALIEALIDPISYPTTPHRAS